MRTLETKLSGSLAHDGQTVESGAPTGEVSWVRRGPLKPDELAEQKKRLDALAKMPDDEIDFSDIPAHTDEELQDFIHGPWTERVERSVTLKVDDEVAAWLDLNAVRKSYIINLLLKREAQRDKRMRASQMDKAS